MTKRVVLVPVDAPTMPAPEFERVREGFAQRNPQLAGDSEKILLSIKEMEDGIFSLYEEAEPDETAASIYLQGRNFLARHIGLPEVRIAAEKGQEDTVKSAPASPERFLLQKHVAVFISPDGPFAKAMSKCLSLFRDTLRYEINTDTRALLKDIIEGRVCGVVAPHLDRSAVIMNHLRHDLKYMPGFNTETAERYCFPPCADFYLAIEIPAVIKTITEMQGGDYVLPEATDERFNLRKEMPRLVALMKTPKKKTKIMVVDDLQSVVGGMLAILHHWTNAEVIFFHQKDGAMPAVPDDTEILLLDEGMDSLQGAEVVEFLCGRRYSVLMASISGGGKPEWARYHFGHKAEVIEKYEAARDFIFFMNELIEQMESDRLD